MTPPIVRIGFARPFLHICIALNNMQLSPVRRFIAISVCILALSCVMAFAYTFSDNPVPEPVEKKRSLKDSIAYKAMLEYDRWHLSGTMRETDPEATAVLKQYWELGGIGIPTNAQLRNSSWQYRHPWSAVFVSWVLREAGAGNRFRYANAHARYIVWARENAGKGIAFEAYDVCDYRAAWPEPGDIICMNRGGKKLNLNTINTNCISHCDIVVEVNKDAKTIVAVGGNVSQTVNKRIIQLDANGFIDASKKWRVPDEEDNNPEGPQTEIFGIIKVR